jgi:glutamate synthase (NADPH) large chain
MVNSIHANHKSKNVCEVLDAQSENELPAQQTMRSLYVPQAESDACGTGFIANLNGIKSHDIIHQALTMLENMEHRGAVGCEENTGDGAGITIQVPHEFLSKKCLELGFELPEFGKYGVGMVFFPKDKGLRKECRILFNDYIDELGFELLGYRNVPKDRSMLGAGALAFEPHIEQIFVKPKAEDITKIALERRLFILRKFTYHHITETFPQIADEFYICSFSYKTLVYKGQLRAIQLRGYYLDLQDITISSAIATVHSRFSTNTVPKWKLAQPFRYIAHNGEINTITGNINWFKAKESLFQTAIFDKDELARLMPICGQALSDSGNFDNVLEFLVLSGRSLPHALMMMIPEAWEEDRKMAQDKRAFYEYHANLMEPWDGPASMCFTDGVLVGATLDRNGLRPSRYALTADNVLVVASEAGVIPLDQSKIVQKGRLQPGRILIADLDEHRIIADDEVKRIVCNNAAYKDWLDENRLFLSQLPESQSNPIEIDEKVLIRRQQLHGLTKEDLTMMIAPLSKEAHEPIGSMGVDTPLAILSNQAQHLANYFKQLFAQVTNPPIDPIRERSVMSLFAKLGGSGNIMEKSPDLARFIHLDQPILKNNELSKVRNIFHPHFKTATIDCFFKADGQKGRLKAALEHIKAVAEDYVRNGVNIVILSDRNENAYLAPIPMLLAVGRIHHHLIKVGLRFKVSIVVETGAAWETHHFATLFGFGANAINPYLAFSTIYDLKKKKVIDNEQHIDNLIENYINGVGEGLLKIMSKIGISTLQSYIGAQIFEILGLNSEVVEKCFTKAISRIEGLGFDEIATETLIRHHLAFPEHPISNPNLEVGGVFQWKRRGESHLFNPISIHHLQVAARKNDKEAYRKYAEAINNQNEQAFTLRGLLTFRKGEPIPIEEVEPVEAIFKRFATGAMSFGSISHEAHTTLAKAMNRIGGKSNSGEGGEDPIRFPKKENGDWERSAIKQVASGRFGVTSHYLVNADELQIKMAQGAKPGEGGQLPGHKVDEWIGKVRHSTPGVGLISPPPHHDIYSIEDLAQLIFDLKNANDKARISVKLVSKAGVGVIASGVAKAHADHILISGHDGGTGASPWTSIRHAGLPWELGLAETHQTLIKNRLRNRVTLQADGQIRTGRDIAIATLLGAEEWGIATAALVVQGCIMMRKCHVNTCPVGIATQDPELRARFTGEVEHVVNFFRFLAEDLREIMANLGFRTINEMVGRVEMLRLKKDIENWKYRTLDLSPILYKQALDDTTATIKTLEQDHGIAHVLDRKLIAHAALALAHGSKISGVFNIINTDRAVGTMLSSQISRKYGAAGLLNGTIDYRFRGSAGQSFGAFAVKGIQFTLEGEANDYFGKGLSGATLIAVPDREAKFEANKNILIGNVAFYGATSGTAYIRGMAGERFAVRNSGVNAVVEGVGDHGCEYMTGGTVVVLGATGKNFAAGMSGGIAYIYNPFHQFEENCNMQLVDIELPSDADYEVLRKMVREHYRFTGSKLALLILTEWESYKRLFTKVMPRDYKKVLEKKKLENEKIDFKNSNSEKIDKSILV